MKKLLLIALIFAAFTCAVAGCDEDEGVTNEMDRRPEPVVRSEKIHRRSSGEELDC